MKSLNGRSRLTTFVVATGAVILEAGVAFAGEATVVLSHATGSAVATVFATGLVNPRGLKFGPDGKLYVAEGGFPVPPTISAPAGLGGLCSTGGGGPGEYTGSTTGSRISRIDASGHVETFVDGLPSSVTGPFASGVADIAFLGNTLYAIFAGAGCSHGVPSIPNGVIRVNPDRSWTMIANLSAFQQAHPVANPTDPITGDFEPDGTWYSMVAVRGDLYAIEPNHGELDKITPSTGAINRVVDVSASQGHIVPTALAYKGNFFFGNLGTFPVTPGSESLFKVTPSGQIKTWAR